MNNFVNNQFNSNPLVSPSMQYQQSNIQYSQQPVTISLPPIPFGHKRCERTKSTNLNDVDQKAIDIKEGKYCWLIKPVSDFVSGRSSCKLCFNKHQKLKTQTNKIQSKEELKQMEILNSSFVQQLNILKAPNSEVSQSEIVKLQLLVKEKSEQYESLKLEYLQAYNKLKSEKEGLELQLNEEKEDSKFKDDHINNLDNQKSLLEKENSVLKNKLSEQDRLLKESFDREEGHKSDILSLEDIVKTLKKKINVV